MDNFFKKNLDYTLSNFTAITSLPLTLFNNKQEQIFTTQLQPTLDFTFYSPIYVNSEIVGYLGAYGNDNQQLAFKFIRSRLEDILNSEFITTDLVKTTARFWKEMIFFYNLMEDIGSIFNISEICEIIIKKIIKIMNINNAQIFLSDNQNELQAVASYKLSNNKTNEEIEKWVFKSGTPLLLNDIENLPHDLVNKYRFKENITNLPIVAVPIKTSSKILGVLKVCQKKHHKMFNSDDFKLLISIGLQVGMAINNIYMITELRETEKIKKEMELASQIQKELLPKTVPAIPHLDIASRCISANAVGGDYYDFFLNDSVINFVLADVSGHGVSAALFMNTVRSTLRGLFSDSLPISEVAFRLNNLICSDSGTSGMFVTLFYLRYFISTQEIAYINSGHNPPIILKGKDKSIHQLNTDGTPAGFLENAKYEAKSQLFEQGDLLVMYTDGFIEAKNKKNKMYGEQKLIDVIRSNRSLSAPKLIDKIYSEVYDYSDRMTQSDDMTIMVIEKK